MTANNFRELLAGWLFSALDINPWSLALIGADQLLACSAIDCPTCAAKGFDPITANDCGTGLIEYLTCPTCSGTGKATVAQLLAWGSAVAQPLTSEWRDHDFPFDAVDDYRNRILGVQP